MQKIHNPSPLLVIFAVIGLPLITCSSINGQPCEVKHNPDVVYSSSRLPSDYTSGSPSSMRLKAVYTNNFKRLSNYHHIVQAYVEPALEFWRSALKVKKPLNKPLRMKRKCTGDHAYLYADANNNTDSYCAYDCVSSQLCYNAEVPREYLDDCKVVRQRKPVVRNDGGHGAYHTDYLVFVDYKYNNCGQNTLAYAIQCQQDKTTDRPEIGLINYCPHNMRFTEDNKRHIKMVTIHELAHAFGFSWNMVPYMRDENNQPRTRRDPQWNLPDEGKDPYGFYKPSPASGGEMTSWWLTAEKYVQRTTKILKTPNVLAAARSHFNCPKLEGVEFENNGGSGTASAHFEKRLYFDEVMVGSSTGVETVSNLTLSFFKDTGWYDINPASATATTWGKGLGCEFATKSCYQYMQDMRRQHRPTTPWCDRVDHYCPTSKKYCTLSKMTERLPETYRYVRPSRQISYREANYYSGVDWLMDYCPYEKECGRRSS